MLKSAVRNSHLRFQRLHLGFVFGLAEEEFLPVKVAYRRMRFHDKAGLCSVNPGGPGAGKIYRQSILEHRGIFAEIPDVARFVLGKPIPRVLGQDTVEKTTVMHLLASHAEDDFGIVRDRELDVLETFRGLTFINKGGAGRQREEWVIDRRDKVRGIDHWFVSSTTGASAGAFAQIMLLVAGLDGVGAIGSGLPFATGLGGRIRDVVALAEHDLVILFYARLAGERSIFSDLRARIEWHSETKRRA
ncbi:MAG: hypothetical protein H0W66_06530 [Chthoniobacterales bacterium]|nr:hypothetical protein [Chthoniobacterales bacterium]